MRSGLLRCADLVDDAPAYVAGVLAALDRQPADRADGDDGTGGPPEP